MKIGEKGLQVIKHYEGFRANAYVCPAGVLTIGYGTTSGVKKGQIITEAQAVTMLFSDCTKFEKVVNESVKVPLNQNQFDALVAFTYNVGPQNFKESTLLKLLNQGNYNDVPAQMLRWNKSKGQVLNGLTARRSAEGHLFATGEVRF